MQQFAISENGKLVDATVAKTIDKVLTDFPRSDGSLIESHMTLLRASAVYSAALESRYEGLHLTTARFNLLKLLYQTDSPQLSISEIAAYLGLTIPSVLRMVQVLEAEGWLQTERSKSDRRVTFVEFTADGRSRFTALIPQTMKIWEELWSGMTPSERSVLAHLLARLRMNLLSRYIGENGLAAFRASEGIKK